MSRRGAPKKKITKANSSSRPFCIRKKTKKIFFVSLICKVNRCVISFINKLLFYTKKIVNYAHNFIPATVAIPLKSNLLSLLFIES